MPTKKETDRNGCSVSGRLFRYDVPCCGIIRYYGRYIVKYKGTTMKLLLLSSPLLSKTRGKQTIV